MCCSPTKTIQHTRLISVILPLSLVWRRLGNSDHPNPGAKLLELHSPKGLGEKVCQLILGVDVAGLDAPLVQAAPNEVVLDADVLVALMEDGSLLRPRRTCCPP